MKKDWWEWEFTVDTAQTDGNTGVPLNPYCFYNGCEDDYEGYVYQPGEQYMCIDWGDGTTSIVDKRSNDYDFTHQYSDGKHEHQITLGTEPWIWQDVICFAMPQVDMPGYRTDESRLAWENTLVSVDAPLPVIKGMMLSRNRSEDFDLFYEYLDNRQSTQPALKFIDTPYDQSSNGYSFNSLESLFNGCFRLNKIPDNLLENNFDITDFSDMFFRCTSLSNIPDGLFSQNKLATDFNHTFCGCGFKTVPDNLFAGNSLAENFRGTFAYSGVTKIPPRIFRSNRLAKDFTEVFCGCGIKTIPLECFKHNQYARRFDGAFLNCCRLSAIPNGFMRTLKYVTPKACYAMFYNDKALKKLPDYIFTPVAAKEKAFRKMAFDEELLKRLGKEAER